MHHLFLKLIIIGKVAKKLDFKKETYRILSNYYIKLYDYTGEKLMHLRKEFHNKMISNTTLLLLLYIGK
jgi:hypothetical protein